jgi:hypothetical protein
MTSTDRLPAQSLDGISFTLDRAGTSAEQTSDVRSVYASVYAEPPHCESEVNVFGPHI